MNLKNALAMAGVILAVAGPQDRISIRHSSIGQSDQSQYAPRRQRKSLRRVRSQMQKASRKRNRVKRSAKRKQEEQNAMNFLVKYLAS